MVSHGVFNNTVESVMSNVDEASLVSYYLPELNFIPEIICSPLRQDTHPSFRVYSPDGVKIRYYDFGTKEKGGLIDLVMRIFNLSFTEALEKIQRDSKGNNKHIGLTESTPNRIKIRSDSVSFQIRTQMREWKEWDFEYWDSYGIPKRWLLHADIYPISFIFIVSETGYIKTVQADKYAYTFVERKDGVISEKVYQPYNKEGFKWRSGHDSSVWDLWTRLPKTGESVIITSSRKDALCIWAQTGIPSVSLQSETTGIKPQVIQELKDRFKNVFVLYDNDINNAVNNGRIDGKKIADTFGVIQLEIPSIYGCKDTSDLYHKYRGNIVKETITKLIEQYAKTSYSLRSK